MLESCRNNVNRSDKDKLHYDLHKRLRGNSTSLSINSKTICQVYIKLILAISGTIHFFVDIRLQEHFSNVNIPKMI